MEDTVVYARLESNEATKDRVIRMIPLEVGMRYECFLNLIRERFELECQPCNLKLMFRPKVSMEMQVPINDDFDLKYYMRSLERGHTEPTLIVSVSASGEKNLESAVFACSNSVVKEVDVPTDVNLDVDVNVNANVEVVDDVDGATNVDNDMEPNPYVDAECLAILHDNTDVIVNETELLEYGHIDTKEEEGHMQMIKFREQLSALDSCTGPEPTPEAAGELNPQQVSVKFSDGSDLRVGKIFATKEEASNMLSILAMKSNFTYKSKKSGKSLLVLKCSVETCTWGIRLTKMGTSKQFEVRTYNGEHNCGLNGATKVHTNASYHKIASLILSLFDSGNGPTPKDIQSFIRQEIGVEVSYWRAWRARIEALEKKRGNFELGYATLPDYFKILKKMNPGTVTGLKLDGDRFKFCFVGFGAALHGFEFIRKVIAVDGTFLTGKYGGVLLCASAQDGNGHIYPLAVCVADSENDASWTWFMERLKECIPDNDEICFISDRNQSIWKAIAQVYPSAHHGCCTVHLWQNCKTLFKCFSLHTTYELAANAYTVNEFNMHMETIEKGCKRCFDYLTKRVGVQRWSRAHFPGNRYNLMNTNIAESLNSTMVVEKQFPIVSLLIAIQKRLSKWFCERRKFAASNSAWVTPKVTVELRSRYDKSTKMDAIRLNGFEYNVTGNGFSHVVNLVLNECSCKKYNIDRIPCSHAIAALKVVSGNDMGDQIEKLCHKYYSNENWMNAYERTVYPTPPPDEWFSGVEAAELKVLPPVVEVRKGRKKTKRIPSVGEFGRPPKKRKRCTKCRKEGHYLQNCPEKDNPNTI